MTYYDGSVSVSLGTCGLKYIFFGLITGGSLETSELNVFPVQQLPIIMYTLVFIPVLY